LYVLLVLRWMTTCDFEISRGVHECV
jgi:hypothetical protein